MPIAKTLLRLLAFCLLMSTLAQAEPVDFVRDVRPIFQEHCYECHSGLEQESGFRLDVKSAALKGGDNHGPDLLPGNASESPLIRFITTDKADELMPPNGKLSAAEIEILTRWVNEGVVWPEGVDLVKLKEKSDHWSFKPLALSVMNSQSLATSTIDTFIAARLAGNGLEMSVAADRVSWLRRVSFDLTGLPPTPEQVSKFLSDDRDEAFECVVEELLSSQRYGERWAQHWLDLVRYADTHGFEVNTERPHAWPYRDYVIRAFNQDTPYDRFIREQIVGDALGEDAATGFLVTASVLLPGQIGQDAPSMRLARQDSLDEIVNNIGQTFLGLSVGCARCHDHKFDPITATDYYAMQAFVSGVEYANRKLRSPEAESQEQAAALLRKTIVELDDRIARIAPVALPVTQVRLTNSVSNVESFTPVEAQFVRFTVHDANVHPDLGLLEPCVDEFEIFTDEPEPQNIALAAVGTKVIASGSKTSKEHQLEFVNDGRYGNERSWMSDERGRGWILFQLPQVTRIGKVIWSRDRHQRYTDRLATAYTLDAGLSEDRLVTLTQVRPLRPAVQPGFNIDRVEPVLSSRLRFTILSTDGLEPCLDELEVIDINGLNVALASHGTQVKTSGDTIVADRHEPSFIHDGRYGNSRSWLSNEQQRGWIELTFPQEVAIEQIVWSRDRERQHVDRSPVNYRIETAMGDIWTLIADSSDRYPAPSGNAPDPRDITIGLSDIDLAAAKRLRSEKEQYQKRLDDLEAGLQVFAGAFRVPDEIHLLNRGDPEQPKEEVLPAVIAALGDLRVSKSLTEQDRRRALADWIASPANPLTARVMANRIWQGHFGRGLVQTPSDFGNNGFKPTHPELLDWLASELIRSGWSIKHLHRLIVLSQTYRQSAKIIQHADNSGNDPGSQDAEVRLLWRYPSRRLEAEAIRDSMLAVSGLLNLKMYGSGYDVFNQRGGLSGFDPIEKLTPDNQRRMIYAHKVRRETESVFGAFDCPDAGQSAALRRNSTTPIQALNLLNSHFTLAVSEAFSHRLTSEAGERVQDQIQRAFQLAFNRDPTPLEQQSIEPIVREHGLAVLCRVLFNCNEFLTIP